MKIICVGGGPAGLYFAISAKLRDAGHDITVIERDPPGATYGWGFVYRDNLLDTLYHNDRESATKLRAASVLWQEQEIRMRDEQTAYRSGYGYGMRRAGMLEILGRRATDLGVAVQYRRHVDDLAEFADADVIVAADGANSRARQSHAEHFETTTDTGANPYIWLGTDKVFDRFVFDFQETAAGWVWCYGYPSGSGISTFVVECQQRTWEGLGLDTLGDEDGVRMLEKIFSTTLDGNSLISRSRGQPARWLHFTEVRNKRWFHDNVVLVGDAAHTTHFTIGSGTRQAMIDAIALAQSLYEHDDSVDAALRAYEQRRQPRMRRAQAEARSSMAWYERVDRYTDRNAVGLAAAMSSRHRPLPPWKYQLHLATQVMPFRKSRRWYNSARRFYRARRRGEPMALQTSHLPRS